MASLGYKLLRDIGYDVDEAKAMQNEVEIFNGTLEEYSKSKLEEHFLDHDMVQDNFFLESYGLEAESNFEIQIIDINTIWSNRKDF